MLIDVSGGQSGIREYLEKGEKRGRGFSRDEADKRVILSGDLEVTDSIIQSLNYEENYHHIILSFKEDFVSQDDLQKATNEFEKFIKAAYKNEEINFYAEAHLPKLKTYKAKNGEIVIRKPHVHIVVPNYNLTTGKYMEPFGRVSNNTHYINAFQELFNLDNGFTSPKNNRRNVINSESEIMARQKGDLFIMNKSEKEDILSFIIKNKIDDYSKFENYLKSQGSIRTRNKGKDNEYLNIKLPHHNKGINLKEFMFSKEFIEEYSYEDKVDFLQKKTENKFIEKKEKYESKKRGKYEELLKDWFDFRAREIKYINYKSKFYKEIYKNSSKVEKIALLNKIEKEFYEKHDLKTEIENEIKGIDKEEALINVSPYAKLESDNVVSQKLRDYEDVKSIESVDFTAIKKQKAYEYLTQIKGVNYEKIKYDSLLDEIYLNKVSHPAKLGMKEFIVEQMNFNGVEIHQLIESINTIEIDYNKKISNMIGENTMPIQVNIKTNEKDKNKVDYMQIGEADRVGRFTGFVYDQADIKGEASATLFVIKDKVVDYEEFKKLPNFKAMDDKMKLIVENQKETRYSKELRMNYVVENFNLTEAGKTYANSKRNFKELKPVEAGISIFEDMRKLDKNIFTVAKEFVQEHYYKAKDKVQFLLTSKRDLAASNIAMVIELQEMKAKLEDIKTYNQAIEAKALKIEEFKEAQMKEAQAEKENGKEKKELSYSELYNKLEKAGNLRDHVNFAKEVVEDPKFAEKKETAISLLNNLKEGKIEIPKEDLKDFVLPQAKTANLMAEKGFAVKSKEAVNEFIDLLKTVKSMSLEQGLNFENLLESTLEKLGDKFEKIEPHVEKVKEEEQGAER